MTTGTKPETILIESIEQFVQITSAWHQKQLATLQHMSEIPEGSKIQLGGGKEVELKGEFLAGFKAGLGTSIAVLGTLPFAYEEEEPETAAATPA